MNVNQWKHPGCTMRAIRINRWGNWNGYEGSRKVHEFGCDEWAARDWLNAKPAQPMFEYDVVIWDNAEQPDFADISRHLRKYKQPAIAMVPDTSSDQYAAVIAEAPMTEGKAQQAFNDFIKETEAA